MRKTRMIKKIMCCTLASAIIMAEMPAWMQFDSGNIVYAEEMGEELTYTDGEVTYTYEILENEKIIITKYSGTVEDVIIPEKIDGKYVTEIDEFAFAWMWMESLTMPDSIEKIHSWAFCGSSVGDVHFSKELKEIGREAFSGCEKLTSLNFPEGLKKIDENAFYLCTSLSEVYLPSTLKYIAGNSFRGTALREFNLAEESRYYTTIDGVLFDKEEKTLISYPYNKVENTYKVPDGVEIIGEYALVDAQIDNVELADSTTSIEKNAFESSSIKGIDLSKKIKIIDERAFWMCNFLEQIELPASVETIAKDAFMRCANLKDISVDSENVCFASIEGVLYDKSKEILLNYPASKGERYKIPEGTKVIGELAFYHCDKLQEIEMNDGLEEIESDAFAWCEQLNSIEFPDSIVYIGSNAFKGCSTLTEVKLPKELICLMAETFCGCSNLEVVYCPSFLLYMDVNVFGACKNLKRIEFSQDIRNISEYFDLEECKNVVISGYFGSNIEQFAKSQSIPFEGKEELTYVGQGFDCSYEVLEDGNIKIKKYLGTDTNVKVPNTIFENMVTEIGDSAFENIDNITTIELPENITTVGNYAFYNCDGLSEIILPDNLESLGDNAFYNCDSLAEIALPESLKYLGDYIFYDCDSITEIVLLENVEKIGNYAFAEMDKLHAITFSAGLRSIGEYALSNTIIQEIILPEGLEDIKDSAFAGCLYLTKVELPNSLKSIGSYAFYNCVSLRELKLPHGLEKVGEVFIGYSSISTIELPATLKKIDENAFGYVDYLEKILVNCQNLSYMSKNDMLYSKDGRILIKCPKQKAGEIVIEEGVEVISAQAFEECDNLESIKYPSTLRTIEYWAFAGCDNIRTICIPDSVMDIERGAFLECKNLESVILPSKLDTISVNMFSWCTNLKSVILPENLDVIDDLGFAGCESLKSVVIPESVTEIKWMNFEDAADGRIIYGYEGSYAQEYAEKYNIEFRSLNRLVSQEENVFIEYTDDALNMVATLQVVGLQQNDEAYANINFIGKLVDETINPEDVIFEAYDISLLDENQNAIQPNGKVTVKMTCPEGYDGDKCKVYYVDEKGNMTDMLAIYANGYLMFETDHFSTYVISEVELKEQSAVVYGDANMDGEVTSKDAVLMKKYLAGYEGLTIDLDVADVNMDGEVTSKDAVRLLRYFAGYDVVLGTQ